MERLASSIATGGDVKGLPTILAYESLDQVRQVTVRALIPPRPLWQALSALRIFS